MGVEIVKATAVYGGRLSGNAYKVLVAMSLSALDKPSNGRPASLYWGGWDALALALGHDDATRNSAGHVTVKRAIKELREAGHITPMNTAARGTRQSYFVHPGGTPKGEQIVPVKGEQIVPVKGEQNVPQRGNETFPPRKEEGSKGHIEDISPTSQAKPRTVREDKDAHEFKGRPGEDCEECGRSRLNRSIHPLRLLQGGS